MTDTTAIKSWTPTPEKIQAMVDRIVREFDPLRIILFGSLARDEGGPDSDVDLYIVLPSVDDKRLAAAKIRASMADIIAMMDIFVTTPDEIEQRGHLINTVLRTALDEGVILYDGQNRDRHAV